MFAVAKLQSGTPYTVYPLERTGLSFSCKRFCSILLYIYYTLQLIDYLILLNSFNCKTINNSGRWRISIYITINILGNCLQKYQDISSDEQIS